ncbi:Glycosyltransferase involved in cell wall bisynthesis [Stigmatella aurantiaca]|uniref:Glycosyltransferase involved in cell wall bisynthesis n=1 Tax=Stigmatella aurantiaca TaxID=41 RepID=A0A1H7G2C8_STIAU|nr:glycosyltransferase [Stigmatella aurantiaca]SEK32204.1 Glycosyltransferase involved in cell wall bisynthesis [Stigmatella aurantiaca]
MPAPVVTVLLPARNAETTVARAVESLLEGTFPDIRVLAVDDGSTDGTQQVLQRLAAQDHRVELLDGGGRGLVAALQLALAHTHSPYVARMDADDEALPRRLEASVEALEADPRLAGVGTGVELFRDDQPVSPSLQSYAAWLNGLTTPEALHRERFLESPLCHPSVCLRRDALLATGAWEDGDFPEDYALWLKLIHAGYGLKNLPEILLRWRDSAQRLTRTDARYAKRRFLWLKAHYLARGPLTDGRPCSVWGAGPSGLTLSRFLLQEGIRIERYIEVHPRKVGTRINGIPVVSGAELGPPGRGLLLVCVGVRWAREELRADLTARGWVEGTDFLCAA